MLVLLWLTVLCFTVDAASELDELSYDDIRQILGFLEVGDTNNGRYSRKPDKVPAKGYPRESSIDGYWPSSTTKRDLTSTTARYPDGHRSSSTTKRDHWTSSTTARYPASPSTKLDHWTSSTTARYPDGHRSSTTKHPEEHWSSTTEYTPVDHSESQPDECEDGYSKQPSEYEQKRPIQVGSIRGIPGISFPDYRDIPLTHFRCSDKVYIPGFYADMETGCQVEIVRLVPEITKGENFGHRPMELNEYHSRYLGTPSDVFPVFHVCWPHRRESFLCPVGTIFNQAILACDYWYSSNCSLASHYYDINAVSPHLDPENKEKASLGSMIDSLLEVGKSDTKLASSEVHSSGSATREHLDVSEILKFLPVKAKVVVYPETAESRSKIIAEASVGKTKGSRVVEPVHKKPEIHKVKPEYIPVRPKSLNPRRPHEKVVPVHKVVAQTKAPRREIPTSVERIIDQVFDIAKKIIKEAEGLYPVLDKGLQNGKRQHAGRKLLPLTKLNPRFITKSVEVPKSAIIEPLTEALKVQKPHVHSRPQTKVGSLPSGKRVILDSRSHKNVSPSTKKALIESYLKLLKVKSG